jgi:hypothetical protein
MSSKNSQRWVVDSFEEQVASIEVEGETMIQLPQSLLPHGTKQGDVLCVAIEIDVAATKKAYEDSREQVKKGREGSAKRDPGGDIAL